MKRRHPYAFSTKPGKGFLTGKHHSWAWGSSHGPFIRAFGGPDLFEGDLEPLVRIGLPRGPPERRWAWALAMGVGWVPNSIELLPVSLVEPLARGPNPINTSPRPLLKLALEPSEYIAHMQSTSPLPTPAASSLGVVAPYVKPSIEGGPPPP
ncbi:hypothetical protein B296_00047819 [Ensete ventricosum]|uniref:Uncharacterized protein n=1 Tax=Ensete ventricosum TaxID=4639 RepID=A0A426YXP6_ENSVE|nr:hypothetical protein B296_00047819 [Ensete ventricosum]